MLSDIKEQRKAFEYMQKLSSKCPSQKAKRQREGTLIFMDKLCPSLWLYSNHA